MAKTVKVGRLRINERLHQLVRDEIAPGTGVDPSAFWTSFGEIVKELAPKNRQLLGKRDALQKKIDAWHLARKGKPMDKKEYREFLTQIGYLEPEGEDFRVTTANVDPEIAEVSGPQLVVPLDNARYALNAANARWGSLYDALYGTNVIPEEKGTEKGNTYNPSRGAKVIAQTEAFLDEVVSLEQGKFSDVIQFSLKDIGGAKQLVATLKDARKVGLADPGKFVGFIGKDQDLSSVLRFRLIEPRPLARPTPRA
jgi:malate synthase